MEAKKRNIKSGAEYDHLFPKAEGATSTIRKNANVSHTVAFIPKVVTETPHHTKTISQKLKGRSTYETCSNIWDFVYHHINYKKDQEGYEQIRSPARSWKDRFGGVDCDCYSTFISSILSNLGIPHLLRITKYHRDYFQHIYPVVKSGGQEIIIDCVTDQFDYEVPYSEKKDYPMDLQYLNGFDGNEGVAELGKLLAKKMGAKKSSPSKPNLVSKLPIKVAGKKAPGLLSKIKSKVQPKALQPSSSPTAPPSNQKKKGVLKKVLNKVNKVNPATVLLRNGILAAMKLNVKNVAKRLRWSYLNPQDAAKQGIDAAKFQRLIATRQKLEKIFYGAGGKVDNLKKAILGGKGNSDKAVSGLDGMSLSGIEYMNAYTALPQLLGRDIYYTENIEGFEGLGQLGEPVTLASVGAAMGVIAGIVAALKQIGEIFPKGVKGAEDFDEKTNEAAENNAPVKDTTPLPAAATTPIVESNATAPIVEESFKQTNNESTKEPSYPPPSTSEQNITMPVEQKTTAVTETNTTTDENAAASKEENKTGDDKQTVWEKYKWLKPVAIGVGGLGIVAIGYALLQPKNSSQRKASAGKSLSGFPSRRKKGKKKNHHRSKGNHHQKKTVVALL